MEEKPVKISKKRDGPNRRARLIVRNLPFKTTEKKLRKHFAQYGQVNEVVLLKKPDGKLVGCGFVQFERVQQAAKALYHTCGKEFLKREIIVDWAVPKDKFVKEADADIKEEPGDEPTKEEVDTTDFEIKEEEEKDDAELKNDDDDDVKVEENEGESDDDVKSEEDEVKSEDEVQSIEPEVKAKVSSNDVSEGRTVFVKNVPFSATNEDLKGCMRQFGRVFYALICKDKLTEHSKGTAFVKFVDKEDAEKCLAAGTELTLQGNVLDCHRALDRNSINQKREAKNAKEKDSRNLYLIKEGVILAGSSAAKDVSKSDMEKRLALEKWKSQILRNLHMYISRVRLVIHNLPPSWDDKKLRALFKKYAGPKAVITEAKVMRNLRDVDANGMAKSKEYGFVSFTNHESALLALRALNNNPNVFTPQRRPIVAFSIENRVMVNAKQKRLQKSKLKNPNSSDYVPEKEENVEETKEVERKDQEFVGVVAKPGETRMRSNFKLKMQAQTHLENVKKLKKSRRAKAVLQMQKVKTKQEKQKKGKRKLEDDKFSKIVNQYKSSLIANPFKKSKWYD